MSEMMPHEQWRRGVEADEAQDQADERPGGLGAQVIQIRGNGGVVKISDRDWEQFDRRVDRFAEDELRGALKAEARIRAYWQLRALELGADEAETPLSSSLRNFG